MNQFLVIICYLLISLVLKFVLTQRVDNKFCNQGQLDSAVRTKSGRIFIFFDSYLTEFTDSLEIRDSNPTPIEGTFSGLNFSKIDAAFTADGENNPKKGNTYFISGDIIKEYSDVVSTGIQKNMSHWKLKKQIIKNINVVINQINDYMVAFYKVLPDFTDRQMNVYNLLYFDSMDDPKEVSGGKYLNSVNLIQNPLNYSRLVLKAVVPLVNGNYLILYNPLNRSQSTQIGKYCVTQYLKNGCSVLMNSTRLCNNEGVIIIPTTNRTRRIIRTPPQTTRLSNHSVNIIPSVTNISPSEERDNKSIVLWIFVGIMFVILIIGGIFWIMFLTYRRGNKLIAN